MRLFTIIFSFNPVSNTGIKSALVRALTIMPLLTKCNIKYVAPNSETMEAIIQSAAGDIRSALNNLLFSSMKGGCLFIMFL